jgi:DNA primase
MATREKAVSFEYAPRTDRRFVRTTKKNRCPICGKSDWCSTTDDRELAFCMRVSAGSIKTAKNGAYIHVLGAEKAGFRYIGPAAHTANVPTPKKEQPVSRVKAYWMNAVYTFLLENLTLDADHAEHLLSERGLSDTTIAEKLYASTPAPSEQELINKLMEFTYGDKLRGIPGFYIDRESRRWRFRFPKNGFFVPCRNAAGEIIGLMVRQDGDQKPKYFWVSTPPDEYAGGASSGSPLHFVYPDRVPQTHEAIITEGALKADRIAEFKGGYPCIAIAGVNNFSEPMAAELKELLPDLATVVIAFDADWQTKPEVEKALRRLIAILDEHFQVGIMEWELADGKGLDDVLHGEREDEAYD